MTQVPATTSPGGEIEQWQDTGLEDFGTTDAVIPRIKIVQDQGMWEDNLTHTKIPNLYFIVLGLVKQRVLFHPNVGDNDVPMCKSSDFSSGYPNPDAPREKSFPWDKSGFDPNDFQPIDAAGKQRVLPCASCQLKEWGSHPTLSSPYCAEQWTMPIYYDASGQEGVLDPNVAWDPARAEWTPAIITMQKSSLKPIRSYLSSFKAGNKPPFLSVCRGTLKVQQKGTVTYSIPSFTKGPESPRERWNEFAKSYGEMRQFLLRPPLREEDVPDAPADNTWQGQPAQQAPAQQQPVVQGTVVENPPQQATPPQQDPWAAQPAQQNLQDPWAAPQETQQQPAAQAPPAQAAPPQPQAPAAPQPPQQPVQQAPPSQPASEPTQEAPAAGTALPF